MSLVKNKWHWFRWVLFHLPGPSIFPKGHLCPNSGKPGVTRTSRIGWFCNAVACPLKQRKHGLYPPSLELQTETAGFAAAGAQGKGAEARAGERRSSDFLNFPLWNLQKWRSFQVDTAGKVQLLKEKPGDSLSWDPSFVPYRLPLICWNGLLTDLELTFCTARVSSISPFQA